MIAGEYVVNVGDLAAGTHFLQILLEDHGATDGYAVSISADTFEPGPPPIPEPASALLLLCVGGALVRRARRRAV